jgi:hypothetical protein
VTELKLINLAIVTITKKMSQITGRLLLYDVDAQVDKVYNLSDTGCER